MDLEFAQTERAVRPVPPRPRGRRWPWSHWYEAGPTGDSQSLLLYPCELQGVAQVRVPFEEIDSVHDLRPRAGVAQDVEPIADVHDEDQAVVDDGVAPHDDLVGAPAQGRILQSHRGEGRGREPTGRARMSRVRDVDRLQTARMP